MRTKLLLLPLAVLAIAIVGCGGEGQGVVGIENPRIRAVNNFNDVTAVSAEVEDEDEDMLTSQAFGAVSAYTIAEDGNRNIVFTDVSGAVSLPLITENRLLETEKYYTAVGAGTGANRVIILLEDGQVIESNMTKTRFVNANEDHADIDVYVTSTATPDLTGQTPIANAVAFGDDSTYTNFTPGNYKIWITNDGSLTPIVTMNVTFDANEVNTHIFAETPGGADTIQTLEDRPLPAGTP